MKEDSITPIDRFQRLSIVVSVFNEGESLKTFWSVLHQTLKAHQIPHEVLFIDDGSTDHSRKIIETICRQYPNCRAIYFSRNFGHEAAMIAGIDYAEGDAVVCMDADLQHPPSALPRMVAAYHEGAEIVNMVRAQNQDSGFIKQRLSAMFYRLLNRIAPVDLAENASDFFLVSSRVANVLKKNFRERNRFLRGFIQIIGFHRVTLSYTASSRMYGESKYSFLKLLKLSLNAIVSFSKMPLYLGMGVRSIFALFSIAVGIYSLIMRALGDPPPGYTTLVVLISFAFSIQFFLIGFIGIYVGYNLEESKKRPIYIIDQIKDSTPYSHENPSESSSSL